MGNRVLLRPDGSKLVVPDTEAEKLKTLGYREETPEQELEQGISAGQADYYNRPGQKVATAIEGTLSGMSLGLTDLALSDQGKERARFHPGIRLATELVGSFSPVGPAGLLTKGAKEAGVTLGRGSKTIEGLVRGGIEGAGFGTGAAITNAQITGDPLTAETILSGLGWGTVFGGGIGGLAGAVESRAAAKAEKLGKVEENLALGEKEIFERAHGEAKVSSALLEGMKGEHAALKAVEEGHFQNLSGVVHDAAENLKTTVKVGEEASKSINFTGLKRSQNAIYSQLADSYNMALVRPEARGFVKEFSAAQLAAKEGKFEKMVTHLEKFKEHMAHIETKLGGAPLFSAEKVVGQANDLIGVAKLRLQNSVAAAEELTQMTALQSTLKTFPKTAEEFLAMKPQTMERLSAAVDELGKVKAAEMESMKVAVKDAVEQMGQGLGIKIEGTPGQQLSGMWNALKSGRGKRAAEELKALKESNLLWGKVGQAEDEYSKARMGGDTDLLEKQSGRGRKSGFRRGVESSVRYGVGSWAAKRLGAPGYALGAGVVTGLMNLKGAILGTIAEKAAKWAPRIARGVGKAAGRIEPLYTRLDGSTDQENKNRVALMQARAKELREAAPGIRDTLYRAVQPLSMEHPELAASMHAASVARFQFILSKLPKDPGLAYSGLKSLWKPDAVAMEKFARYYHVFQDPVGVMNRALDTGKITMEEADGLKNMNPELFSFLRVEMLQRISDPKVRDKLSYQDQVHLGVLLDLPVHSTMDPRFIASQQQMYTERNKPLEMNPRIQPGGGAGRPSGPGPSATSSQRITEH